MPAGTCSSANEIQIAPQVSVRMQSDVINSAVPQNDEHAYMIVRIRGTKKDARFDWCCCRSSYRFRSLWKARLSRGDRGITICGTAFAGRWLRLVILFLSVFELERSDGEGILAPARLRAQLSLPRSDGTWFLPVERHWNLRLAAAICTHFQTCHAEEGFCAKDILQTFERRHCAHCTDVLACFGQLSAADLCLMRISVPKSVICWSCKPRASDFSRQGVEPNEAAAQAILQVLGSARGGSSSSRLEFGEAEARWKVTKSRHVIAEGFLRSVHRQQGSNKGRSSNKANKGRNSKNVLHLHLWAANRFLVLTFAEIIWDPFVQMFGFQLWMFTAIVAATQNLES